MRQRITFIVNATEPEGGDPPFSVQETSLRTHSLKGAKEHRVSLDLDQLPAELRSVLEHASELFIRWTSPITYPTTLPFLSRLPPGLHVFYTPRGRVDDHLCSALKIVFSADLKCSSPEETFVRIPTLSERFSSSTRLQYHHLLPSISQFVVYIQSHACSPTDTSCHDQLSSLQQADYLDINFDAISRTMIINVFWHASPDAHGWTESITKPTAGRERVEVGILQSEKASEPEELSLGGYLTMVGEDDHPSPTLFSFPSRHHPLVDASAEVNYYSVDFPYPTGLHPTLRITLPSSSVLRPPSESCALHTYLSLPSAVFVDRYQLADPMFLASKGIKALRALYGETDLEDPDWVVKKWGSVMLLELARPTHPLLHSQSDANVEANSGESRSTQYNNNDSELEKGTWEINIPLHLRYLPPSSSSSSIHNHNNPSTHHNSSCRHTSAQMTLQIPWPVTFWACPASETLKEGTYHNPFDRPHLGYDTLFGPRTIFYHLSPRPAFSSSSSSSVSSSSSFASCVSPFSSEEEETISEKDGVVGVDIAGRYDGKGNGKGQEGLVVEELYVPVLDLDRAAYVELGTVSVGLIGFVWICGMLFLRAPMRNTTSKQKDKEKEKRG